MSRRSPRVRDTERIARSVLAVCLVLGAALVLVVIRDRTSTIEVAVEEIAVAADDLTVSALVSTNSCGEPDRLVFDETAVEVRVTARVRQRSGDCEDIRIQHRLSGTLSAPLAGRTISSG